MSYSNMPNICKNISLNILFFFFYVFFFFYRFFNYEKSFEAIDKFSNSKSKQKNKAKLNSA